MTEYVKIPNIFKRETFGKNKLIEGEYSSPELEYLKDAEWEFTYKANGTNIRICWDGYRVSFMGRTDKAQIPAHLLARLSSSERESERKFKKAVDFTALLILSCLMSTSAATGSIVKR